MWILKLKAVRGWSASQVAEVFAVSEKTIVSWLKRVDEEGERARVQIAEPVNIPDFVRYQSIEPATVVAALAHPERED